MKNNKTAITVETTVKAPIEKVWKFWTEPEHIKNWNNASEDWHTPRAENDLRIGGKFLFRMEAKDGSFGFDFYGVYDDVRVNEYVEYTIGDGRKVKIYFSSQGNETKVVETFETENTHPLEVQRSGWRAILNNFKKYIESNQQKITTFLWFDDKAEEGANFYISIFKNSKILNIARYGEDGAEVSGRPKGTVMTIAFQLDGQEFTALNGGPIFKFTPAISFFVHRKTEHDIDHIFKKLSSGGEILMPLDKYPPPPLAKSMLSSKTNLV